MRKLVRDSSLVLSAFAVGVLLSAVGLEKHDAQAADLVKLKFFAGLDQREAGALLGLPARSAGRRWAYARAGVFREIERTRAG